MNVSGYHTGEVLRKFAEQYNLRVEKDDCGAPVISGARGDIYEHGRTELAVMIISEVGTPNPRLWNIALEKCSQAGMTLRQNGDAEGSFSFDLHNKQHVLLAIKLAGVRRKKRISETHKGKLLVGLRRYQSSDAAQAILEGGSRC